MSHLAWKHLWIPQEDLGHAATKRELDTVLSITQIRMGGGNGWMVGLCSKFNYQYADVTSS